MNKIIRIEPVDRVFSITWNLGPRCNYDCMYCPTSLHDAVSKHKSLDEMKRIWEDIIHRTESKNLQYKISMTGGEVTGNKDLVRFLEWLRDNYSTQIQLIQLTTNGSATLKYYTTLMSLIDNISFSLHSEHVDEKKFFDTVITLHKALPRNKHIHVNIMDEYWNQDRIVMYGEVLSKHQISHSVNQIDYTPKTREYPIMKGKLNLAITST